MLKGRGDWEPGENRRINMMKFNAVTRVYLFELSNLSDRRVGHITMKHVKYKVVVGIVNENRRDDHGQMLGVAVVDAEGNRNGVGH